MRYGLRPKKQQCILCKICAKAEETVQRRACDYNITPTDGSTLIEQINAPFAIRIKKRPMTEAMQQRANILYYGKSPGLAHEFAVRYGPRATKNLLSLRRISAVQQRLPNSLFE